MGEERRGVTNENFTKRTQIFTNENFQFPSLDYQEENQYSSYWQWNKPLGHQPLDIYIRDSIMNCIEIEINDVTLGIIDGREEDFDEKDESKSNTKVLALESWVVYTIYLYKTLC